MQCKEFSSTVVTIGFELESYMIIFILAKSLSLETETLFSTYMCCFKWTTDIFFQSLYGF